MISGQIRRQSQKKKFIFSKNSPFFSLFVQEAKIFNHSLEETVDITNTKAYKYPSRALALTLKDDVIQLPQTLQKWWGFISSHYDRVGLEYSKNIIWDTSFNILKEYQKHTPSVYLFLEETHKKLNDIGWYNMVQLANSKNKFIKLCEELGTPVPKTKFFNSKKEFVDIDSISFPIVFKQDVSLFGGDVAVCRNLEELKSILVTITDDQPFQLQQLINYTHLISNQYSVGKNGVLIQEGVTNQLMEKGTSTFSGNSMPCPYKAWFITDPIAEYLVKGGLKGHFGFDLAVIDHGIGDPEFYIFECNPRFTASWYDAVLASKLGRIRWRSKIFYINKESLPVLDLTSVEYNKKTKRGLVIVNWGDFDNGKLSAVMFGKTDADIDSIETQFTSLLEELR